MENEATESVESTEVESQEVDTSADDAITTDFNDNIVEVDTIDTNDVEEEITEIDFENMSEEELADVMQYLENYKEEAAEEQAPEYELPSKFKDVNDLIKSYQMLEGKIGNFKGAPEQYEIEGADMNDPLINDLTETARELNMSNEALNTMINKVNESHELLEESRIQEEMQSLGPNAESRINNINNFIETNLSPHQAEVLQSMATSADNISVIESMIQMARPSGPTTVQPSVSAPSDSDLQEMMYAKDEYGNLKMETDSKYADKVNKLMSNMWG
jgi:hypothetical protein